MEFDRKKESKSCYVCKAKYDTKKRRPCCLIPCGHTICQRCIQDLGQKKCALCKSDFNQFIPDYAMIDIIDELIKINRSKETSSEPKQIGPEIIHLINEGTSSQQLIGLRKLRQQTTKESNPPLQEVIDYNILSTIVEFLESDNYEMVFEATWILLNVASGNSVHTQSVVDAGAVPKLLKLINPDKLNDKHGDIAENAIWALGNIAGDTTESRNMLLEMGFLEKITQVLYRCFDHEKISLKRNSIWTLSNLLRYKNSKLESKKIIQVLTILKKYFNLTDEQILTDCCWATAYITDGENNRIQLIIDNLNIEKIVNLLRHSSSSVVLPALRTVGNIVTGDEMQTQTVIDQNAVPILVSLLSSVVKDNLLKETCWALSNITAGNEEQISAVIETKAFEILSNNLDKYSPKVKKEILWILSNAMDGGSDEQKESALKYSWCPLINSLLEISEYSKISLNCLEKILKFENDGETKNFTNQFLESGGVQILEKLFDNGNFQAQDLIDTYFNF